MRHTNAPGLAHQQHNDDAHEKVHMAEDTHREREGERDSCFEIFSRTSKRHKIRTCKNCNYFAYMHNYSTKCVCRNMWSWPGKLKARQFIVVTS